MNKSKLDLLVSPDVLELKGTLDPTLEKLTHRIIRNHNYNIGTAIKYLLLVGKAGVEDKAGEMKFLQQAKFYINEEISRLESEGFYE